MAESIEALEKVAALANAVLQAAIKRSESFSAAMICVPEPEKGT